MKLWQVDARIDIRGDTGYDAGKYHFAKEMPRFYVRAISASEAITQAIRVACASASPRDEYRSAGTVIAVSIDRGVVVTDSSTERRWSDIDGIPA